MLAFFVLTINALIDFLLDFWFQFNDSEIIVKVKEPLFEEVKMIKENQIVFTYLHFAAAKELTEGLIN